MLTAGALQELETMAHEVVKEYVAYENERQEELHSHVK
jgi:hypothetical protein